MARPKVRPDALPTRDLVLRAAVAVFAERGFDGATLAQIAEAAGITRPSLLYHFESKDALYAEVVGRAFRGLALLLQDAMGVGGASFEARLEAVARRFVGFLAEREDLARLFCRELLERDGPGARVLQQELVPVLDSVVAFVERDGAGQLQPGLPVRAAILQVLADVVLQVAAVGVPVWGAPDPDRTWALVRALFLGR